MSDKEKAKLPDAVYFCEKSGERIVAPGVSKTVDPKNGQALYVAPKQGKGDK